MQQIHLTGIFIEEIDDIALLVIGVIPPKAAIADRNRCGGDAGKKERTPTRGGAVVKKVQPCHLGAIA